MPYLEELNFHLVGYGCTTCIGNSGPLPEAVADGGAEGESGGGGGAQRQSQFRRPHQSAGEGELPGLAAAGGGLRAGRHASISIWRTSRSAQDTDGKPVYLSDIWPTHEEVRRSGARDPSTREMFQQRIRERVRRRCELAGACQVPTGDIYRVGRHVHLHQEAAVLRQHGGSRTTPLQDLHGHARAGAARRFGHHRSHLAGRLDSRRTVRPASI